MDFVQEYVRELCDERYGYMHILSNYLVVGIIIRYDENIEVWELR